MKSLSAKNIKYGYQKKVRPVTICIVAACDTKTENPKMIHCSDIMITSSIIQFEHAGQKLFHTSQPNCYIMCSGDIAKAKIIVDMVNTEINSHRKGKRIEDIEIGKIAQWVSKYCRIIKDKSLDDNVLKNYGLTVAALPEKLKLFSDMVSLKILEEINDHDRDFQLGFLVFGMNSTNKKIIPHIYRVEANGDIGDYSSFGFAMIGSGEYEAESDITRMSCGPAMNFGEAVQKVYFAKKWSERSRGVGHDTELGILVFTRHPKNKNKFAIKHMYMGKKSFSDLDEYLIKEKQGMQNIRDEVTKEIDSSLPKIMKDLNSQLHEEK